MKKILLCLVIILTTGCAVKPLQYEVAGLESSVDNVIIEDLRPPSESEQKIFSYLITSEAYGISRNKEKIIEPDRVRLLQHRAFEKFGESNQPTLVKLHHFVTYTNNKSGLRKSAMFGALGALAANSANKKGVGSEVIYVDSEAFEAGLENEHQRAFYTEEEYPSGAASFVIYIDAEINDKRTFIKKISPVTAREDGTNAYVAAVDDAISALLSNH